MVTQLPRLIHRNGLGQDETLKFEYEVYADQRYKCKVGYFVNSALIHIEFLKSYTSLVLIRSRHIILNPLGFSRTSPKTQKATEISLDSFHILSCLAIVITY